MDVHVSLRYPRRQTAGNHPVHQSRSYACFGNGQSTPLSDSRRAHFFRSLTPMHVAAINEYRCGNDFWPASIIRSLEGRARGASFEWARDCLCQAFAELDSAHPYGQWFAALDTDSANLEATVDTTNSLRHDPLCLAFSWLAHARFHLDANDDLQYANDLIRVLRIVGDIQPSDWVEKKIQSLTVDENCG